MNDVGRMLIDKAREVIDRPYCPYSNFRVASAVLTRDGKVFVGVNVENAAYGECICAERVALTSAVAAGCRPGDFVALAVYSLCNPPASPCGSCRQVICELMDGEGVVYLGNDQGVERSIKVADLLPFGFGKDDLR